MPLPSAPQQPAPRKKTGLIIGVVAGIVVLLGGLIWWFMASSQDAYVKAADAYEQKLVDAFNRYKNSEDIENEVDEVKQAFDTALAARPAEPNLLGLPLGSPSATRDRVATITTEFTKMRDGFVDLHEFNDFAGSALDILDDLSRITPLIEFDENITAFNKAADDIAALKGPSGINEFKQQKADVMREIAAEIEKGKVAYKNAAAADYSAADNAIKGLLPQLDVDAAIDELQKIYRTYYDSLSDQYEKVAKLLGIKG